MIARTERVHGNTVSRDLLRPRFHKAQQPRSRSIREDQILYWLFRGDRGDSDDSAPFPFTHMRHGFSAKIHCADQVELESIAIVPGFEISEEAGRWPAG